MSGEEEFSPAENPDFEVTEPSLTEAVDQSQQNDKPPLSPEEIQSSTRAVIDVIDGRDKDRIISAFEKAKELGIDRDPNFQKEVLEALNNLERQVFVQIQAKIEENRQRVLAIKRRLVSDPSEERVTMPERNFNKYEEGLNDILKNFRIEDISLVGSIIRKMRQSAEIAHQMKADMKRRSELYYQASPSSYINHEIFRKHQTFLNQLLEICAEIAPREISAELRKITPVFDALPPEYKSRMKIFS